MFREAGMMPGGNLGDGRGIAVGGYQPTMDGRILILDQDFIENDSVLYQ